MCMTNFQYLNVRWAHLVIKVQMQTKNWVYSYASLKETQWTNYPPVLIILIARPNVVIKHTLTRVWQCLNRRELKACWVCSLKRLWSKRRRGTNLVMGDATIMTEMKTLSASSSSLRIAGEKRKIHLNISPRIFYIDLYFEIYWQFPSPSEENSI